MANSQHFPLHLKIAFTRLIAVLRLREIFPAVANPGARKGHCSLVRVRIRIRIRVQLILNLMEMSNRTLLTV